MSTPETRPAAAAALWGGYWAGVAALVLAAVLWSLNGPLIKLLNDQGQGLGGEVITCYRSLLGGLIFLPLALRRMHTLRLAPLRWSIGSVLTFTLMTTAFVIATTRTAAANAIVLQYTAPLWVFALAPLVLRERARLSEGLALAVAMAGVAVILALQPRGDLVGLSIALTSGLGYGLVILMLRGLRLADPIAVVTMNFLGSGLILAVWVGVGSSFRVTTGQFVLLAIMSVVQFAFPYVLFSWALQRVEAHHASLITLLEMVLNPLWVWLAVGERVPGPTLLGGPLVLAGVAGWMLLTWRNEQRKRASPVLPDSPAPRA
jgi:DME family drug/metabolite transporter